MAKELPYFKFEPGAWDTGNIQMCNKESKGLFMDICSMYWSRLGELPEKLVINKLCNSNPSALEELYTAEVIYKDGENIIIEFLEEQFSEFDGISEERRKASRKRWDKYKKDKELQKENPNGMQLDTKSNPIREDKRREEEIREDINTEKFIFKRALLKYGFNKKLVDDWLKVRKTKRATNTETAFKKFINEVESSGLDNNFVLKLCVEKSWSGFNKDWVDKKDLQTNSKNKTGYGKL